MHVTPLKTHKVTGTDTDLLSLIDQYVPTFEDGTVLAVASKIVAICEGRLVKADSITKEELVKQESEYYLPSTESDYDISLTITRNILIPTAGIDESNGDGNYILWPADPQATANAIREHLSTRFSLKKVGVVITDSKTTPLRWGTTGIALAHSGFKALNNYVGEPDIFGKEMHVTKANVMDALASAAVVVMGEGSEQTPLAMIRDIPFVEFQDRNPTSEEIQSLNIPLEKDLYAPMLKKTPWQKGLKSPEDE